MLPEGWSRACVRDVVDPSRRVTYGIVQPGPRQERGVPIIRGRDYSSGRVDDTDLYLVSPEVASKYGRSTVRGGDILMSIVGYLGLVAVVPEHLSGANITQTTARVAVAPPNIPEFFFQQFQSRAFQGQVRRYQKGSAQPGLNLADVDKMEVLVPPVPEQQRISAILRAVDEAIAAGEAVVEQLDRVRRDLLVTLMRPPGATGTGAGAWSCTTLGELATDVTYGTSMKLDERTGAYPVLRIPNVVGQTIDADLKYLDLPPHEAESLRLVAGDLLMVRTNGNPNYVGRSLLFPSRKGTWLFASYLIRVRVDSSRMLPAFLHYALQAPAVRRSLERGIRTSAGNYNLNAKGIRATELSLPPLPEQRAIVTALGAADDRMDRERATIVERRRLKAALAEVLLTGKIRVPVQDGV